MGTANIRQVHAGDDIREDDNNQFFAALTGNVVPRNVEGEAEDLAGNLGSSTFRWRAIYVEKIVGATSVELHSSHGAVLPANPDVGDIFIKTSSPGDGFYYCETDNAWKFIGSVDAAVGTGNVLPANPDVGDIFIKTSGGQEGFYYCKTDDIWTPPADLSVEDLRAFMLALRTDSLIISESLTVTAAGLEVDTNGDLVSVDGDAIITASITNPTTSHEFKMSALDDLPEAANGATLTDSNSIHWDFSGTTFRIARGENGHFFFSSDTTGTYDLTLRWNRIAVPASVLPRASGTEAGIIQPEEYTRIHAAIDAEHLHDTPEVTASMIEGADALLFDDASVADGEGSQVKEIRFSELDKRWYKYPSGTRFTAANLPLKLVDFLAAASEGGWLYSTDMQVQTGALFAAKPTLAVAAGRAYADFGSRGPRFTDVWDAVRVPKGSVITNARYVIGERNEEAGASRRPDETDYAFTSIAGTDWGAKLGTRGAYDYYSFLIADKPADADQFVEEHEKFTLDGQLVAVCVSALAPLVLSGSGQMSLDRTAVPVFWYGTQAEYDAVAVKDDNTVYFVEE